VWDLEAVWGFGEQKYQLINKSCVNLFDKNKKSHPTKIEDQLFARKEFSLKVNLAKTK
jgi:hypothetical protein